MLQAPAHECGELEGPSILDRTARSRATSAVGDYVAFPRHEGHLLLWAARRHSGRSRRARFDPSNPHQMTPPAYSAPKNNFQPQAVRFQHALGHLQ